MMAPKSEESSKKKVNLAFYRTKIYSNLEYAK